MLGQLFGVSNAKVLAALAFADAPLHLRELARRANVAPTQASRILTRFVRAGLADATPIGKMRLFSLRRENRTVKLLCELVEETAGVTEALRSELRKDGAIQTAFVYGSFASGKEGLKSDVDLMIIGRPDLASLSRRISRLESKFGREINYAVYSEEEFERKKSSPFLSRILKSERNVLVEK